MEVVRCGGGELHAVAAVVGGMGSQEVVPPSTSTQHPINLTANLNVTSCQPESNILSP